MSSGLPSRPAPDWQSHLSLPECVAYAYDYQVACDVTFVLMEEREDEEDEEDEVQVPAHKLVLSLRSPVFFAMFQGGLAEGDVVRVEDVPAAAFKEMLRYLYKDSAVLSMANVSPLLYASHKYMLPGLSARCTAFLERSLSVDNVCWVLEQALLVGENALSQRCLQLMMARSRQVLSSPAWTHASRTVLDHLLDCPHLSVGEVEVFEACLAWSTSNAHRQELEQDAESHRQLLGPLLYKIQMGNMSLEEFSKIVVPTGLLSEPEELAVYRSLTNKNLRHESPFSSGRQNRLLLLKPLRIVDGEDGGECNYDSETFTYSLNVLSAVTLVELHVYDLTGPHIINLSVRSPPDDPQLEASLLNLHHERRYKEKGYDVLVFKLGELAARPGQLDLSLSLLGEYDTVLYDSLTYGDKHLMVARKCKESPLFGLGYLLEEGEPATNPLPPVSVDKKRPAPPLPPRRPRGEEREPRTGSREASRDKGASAAKAEEPH